MKTSDSVGVTFVNAVLGRGVLNNVVNITFGTFNFTPSEDEQLNPKVDPDLVVSSRLRMDLSCARQLYEALGTLLNKVEEDEAKSPVPASANGVAAGKPN